MPANDPNNGADLSALVPAQIHTPAPAPRRAGTELRMITTNAESDDGPNGFGETVSSPDNYGLAQTPSGLCSRRILEAGFYGRMAEEEKKEEVVEEEEKKEEELEEKEEPVEDGAVEEEVEADGSSGDAEGEDAEGEDAEGEDADGVDAKKSCWTALFCCKIFRK